MGIEAEKSLGRGKARGERGVSRRVDTFLGRDSFFKGVVRKNRGVET